MRCSFPWDMIEAQKFPQPLAFPQSQKAAGFPGVRHPADISIESVGYVEMFWGLKQSSEKVYTTFSSLQILEQNRSYSLAHFPDFTPPDLPTRTPASLGWFQSEPPQEYRVGPNDLLRFLCAFRFRKCTELFTLLYSTTTFFSYFSDLAIYTISFALQFLKSEHVYLHFKGLLAAYTKL